MSFSVFFYGTLMSSGVLGRVLCGSSSNALDRQHKLDKLELIPCYLKGHLRSSLKGEDYPAVIKTGKETDSVLGTLCKGLTEDDVKFLDAFEGDEYERCSVTVHPIENDQEKGYDADIYIWISDKSMLTYIEWSIQQFKSSGKESQWLDRRCEYYDVDALHVEA
ncbi:hypothetical protein K501DRAFT_332201 [Backusella circina FSU 941]|nr:hypothetical protein K501DRAFT_332201 [Backusella circina FSU 941]